MGKRKRITPADRRKARKLRPSIRAESAYAAALRGLARAFGAALLGDARRIVEARQDGARADGPALRSVGSLMTRAQPATRSAFDAMARAVDLSTKNGLREFGVNTIASDKRLAKAVAKRQIENVALVKDVATQVREQIAGTLAEYPGIRWEDIADKLQERIDVGESRAELIARDQVLSTNGEFVAIRQEAAGVTEYVWSTSLDERVREDHADREGEVFEWSDAPEDGHPGEPILCRCVAIPVLPDE